MRWWIQAALIVASGHWAGPTAATEVVAGPATDLSVTIYRSPGRASGSLVLDALNGFALVSETRSVTLPAGESRLRFEGVADGIESASVILSGLPADILEKNRDAQVLSPSALVAANVGRDVELVRTNPRDGQLTRIPGKIRSGPDGGVVFESVQGVEALRCSGWPETFSFSGASDLAATPALSARVRSAKDVTATVTLSYLAHAFDWAANYVAMIAPDGKTMDLGAWVTLGNGNAVSFPAARTQVVAGRLNRSTGAVEPLEAGNAVLAQCWPSATTSDLSEPVAAEAAAVAGGRFELRRAVMSAPMPAEITTRRIAQLVEEEQLGDLKLYRVPARTLVNSREIKQVRLLDREAIPVELFYGADLPANQNIAAAAARRMLRTRNDAGHHLGLPLPSGRVDCFEARGDSSLLLNESPLRDVALDEEFELDIGSSPDVQISSTRERTSIAPAVAEELPLLPGIVRLQPAVVDEVSRIEIDNARHSAIALELQLRMPDGMQLIAADHAVAQRNGRPLFKLSLAAGTVASIRYQTEHTSLRPAPQ